MWGVRIEGYSGLHPGLADALQCPVQVGAGFIVHIQPLGTTVMKLLDIWIGVGNHQVGVQRFGGPCMYGLNYR